MDILMFYLIFNNIKCDTYYDIIVYISMFILYPLSIAMDYTSFDAKCQFGCHDWSRVTQNISCYSCKNQILSAITFSPTQNIKI